jgi:hypothetical protein
MVGGYVLPESRRGQSAVASRGDWVYPAIPQADSTCGFFNIMTLEGTYRAHATVMLTSLVI